MDFDKILKSVESGETEFKGIDTSEFSDTQIFDLRKAQVVGNIKRLKATVVVLSVYAEAYYSGQTYSEDFMMLADDFIKFVYDKGYADVTDYDMYDDDEEEHSRVYVGELDGKHSEVYAPLSVKYLTEEEVGNFNFSSIASDGDYLENYIFSNMSDRNTCRNNIKDYLKNIDRLTEITVTVRESQVKLVEEFVAKLNNNR